ncbi:MAG: transglycosylase SLT domain-containing protein [Gammaproteobacteria bacterium]|jgi:soluble lytic murein transglycosylase|nr:transglycosylase SLT domain-containing protein [Gammaproteobacteria bacterium]MBK7522334.1 transglycosylase SLT domain-containing protein [Gammaproteobacteria bacterium]MBK7728678.1 transglycosylase SLT domain-containing protein [Gammaproteobacteria bacterium]
MVGSLRFGLLFSFLLLLQAQAVVADTLEAQRAQYRSAFTALTRGDAKPLERHRASLQGYPLYPYLELEELRRRISSASPGEIDRFLARHAGQLPASRLRAAWLQVLQSQQRWDDYLHYYVDDPANIERRCVQAWALLQTGQSAAAQQRISALWLSPRSLPKSCDALFQAWYKRGNPGSAMAWQRFNLAMGAGEYQVARYLTRFMDAAHTADATLYLQIKDNPALVGNTQRFRRGNPRHSQIVEFGLLKLAGSNTVSARRNFESYARSGVLDTESMRNVAPRIAANMASNSGREALEWILGLEPAARSDALSEDAVRYALRGSGWEPVMSALQILPPALVTEQRWEYWSARAREAGNTLSASEEISNSYHRVRATRSYYGFLAADRLGMPYEMQHVPVPVSDELLAATGRNPGISRAREFFLIGNGPESRREWQHTILAMPLAERLAAAKLADQWGWHQLAITTLASVQNWDDLELRFPILFSKQFDGAARGQGMDNAWLYAIARQESAMNATVKSPAGALGLMQVMPATAQLTARRAGIRYRGSSDLLDPSTNVTIGSRYMRMMLDDFQQNRILAAAAYNAGPGRVRQWLRRLPDKVEHDRFVETIPFRETRQYVQNVLSFAVVYAYLQGRSTPLVQPGEQLIRNPYFVQTALAE